MSVPSVHTSSGPFGVIPLSVATSPEVQGLSHRAIRLYLVLLARHNAKRDGWAWSLTALANDTGILRKHVPEAIQQIAQAGLVEIESGGGRASTHYRCTMPPSLRLVPTAGTATPVQSPRRGLQQSPRQGLVNAPEGTAVVPTAGTTVVPTAGTTRQRRDNDGTLEPPYPHSDTRTEEGNPPSPPASRGEHEGAPPRFELPARMRGAKRPDGFWRLREEAAQAQPVAPAPERELPPMPTRGDAVRQLARDLGVRPREARKMIEREEIIASRPEVPAPVPVVMTDDMARELMRDFGWSAGELRQRYGWTPQGEA